MTYDDFKKYCIERFDEKREAINCTFDYAFEYFPKQYICRYERYKELCDGIVVGMFSYDVEYDKEVQLREFYVKQDQLQRISKLRV